MNPTDFTAALVAGRRETYLAEAAQRRLTTHARRSEQPALVATLRSLATAVRTRWAAAPAGRRPAPCACNA